MMDGVTIYPTSGSVALTTSGTGVPTTVPSISCCVTGYYYEQLIQPKGKKMDLVNIGFGLILIAIAIAILAGMSLLWWEFVNARRDKKRAEKRERKAAVATGPAKRK